jgi:hypothetical protein
LFLTSFETLNPLPNPYTLDVVSHPSMCDWEQSGNFMTKFEFNGADVPSRSSSTLLRFRREVQLLIGRKSMTAEKDK